MFSTVTEFDYVLNFLVFSQYSFEQAWLIEGFTLWQKMSRKNYLITDWSNIKL